MKGVYRHILKTRILSRLLLPTALSLLLGWLVFGSPFIVHADALLTVEPITWNVIGLDSNNVNTGPEDFPVGVRVCNPLSSTTSVNNVSADFVWTSANSYIDLRVGSLDPITPGVNLAPGDCYDFYFEVTLSRDSDAYDMTRRYRIDVSGTDSLSGLPVLASSPTPREIFVEYLISQSRNSTMDVKLDNVSIPPGGTMALMLGESYTIELIGKTATNGYEQIESYINFPNTIFQINSVTTTYSADGGTDPLANTKLYADGCDWENDPNSPNYRSCLSTGKYGGDVSVVYDVTIIGGAGTTQILNTLIYDFSGSSYHYNSDFSVAGRIAAIVDPSLITISKNFTPNPSNIDGATTLTFTLNNPNGVAISGANFTDTFPTSPDDMVVADPTGATTSGCGSPTFAPTADAASISFSDGTIAANGTCTVSVLVTAPTAGTYLNTSDNLFIDTMDTGNFASDSLVVSTNPGPPPCTPNLELATWIMDPSQGTVTVPPNPWFVASNVATAQAFQGSGITSSIDTAGNPANSWEAHGFARSTFDLADNDYFQFNIDTSNFTQINMAFDARRSSPGPSTIFLYYSTTGTEPYTPIGLPDPFAVSTSWGNFSQAFAGASTTGTTFFRIYGF